jgi:hypothetical protein
VIERSSPVRVGALAIPVALALLCPACGGAPDRQEAAPLVFSGSPAQTVISAGGQANIAVRWSWSPPVVGLDAGELTITDGAGAPLSGLALAVVPWMPAHGHGASVAPAWSEVAPGVYDVAPLDFYMSGTWQLLTTITRAVGAAGGAIDDTAQPSVDIP